MSGAARRGVWDTTMLSKKDTGHLADGNVWTQLNTGQGVGAAVLEHYAQGTA